MGKEKNLLGSKQPKKKELQKWNAQTHTIFRKIRAWVEFKTQSNETLCKVSFLTTSIVSFLDSPFSEISSKPERKTQKKR